MTRPTPVPPAREIDYPDSDGKPMGETPLHVKNLSYLVEELEVWFEDDPLVFVAGNMFVYYDEGSPRKHVSPDVFVVRGVPKETAPPRRKYLMWQERPLDFVIELTSKSTRAEDMGEKLDTYRDVIGVKEYFLFDPYAEYLDPPLQGFRLRGGRYVPIKPDKGRLPSRVTGLHLEIEGSFLRLYDPTTGRWLRTPREDREALRQAEQENERLRQEMEALRRRLAEGGQRT